MMVVTVIGIVLALLFSWNYYGQRSVEFNLLYDNYKHILDEFMCPDLLRQVIEANKNYTQRNPFPHGHYDGLFPQSVLDVVDSEIPDDPIVEKHGKKEGCIHGTARCYVSTDQMLKNAFEDEAKFGPATLAMFHVMKSRVFTNFLEQLTGIHDLIPDPEYRGSGIHQTLPGGYLGIHADFNCYKKYGNIHRRVNVFVFLNHDWKPEYGGALELWSRNLKSCGAKYLPVMNRIVVFSSTDYSYHGHPHPLTVPQGRSRRSLALYYYTKTRPISECENENCFSYHSTLFKDTYCNDCEDQPCLNFTNP